MTEESSSTPRQWMLGQTLEIRDFRGRAIAVDPSNGNQTITTNARGASTIRFLLETAPLRYQQDETYINGGGVGLLVAFRLIINNNNNNNNNPNVGNSSSSNNNNNNGPEQESPLYLTINMYGDEAQRTITEAVANYTPLLPVHVPLIVDFLVDRPTGPGNFEGPGYNYSPLTLAPGSPNYGPSFLQVFLLVRNGDNVLGERRYGIKSLFGTYWRSEHWNNTISQSPHCEGDERWNLIIQSLPELVRKIRDEHNRLHDSGDSQNDGDDRE
jgi:hypothetical protein